MITHVGGLNSVISTTLNLPSIRGGKMLIYTNIDLELTPLADLEEKGKSADDPMLLALAAIVRENNGLWSAESEKYLLANARSI